MWVVSTRRSGHGVGLAMATCRGLVLVWPLAVEMLDGGGEPKLPSKASPMTRLHIATLVDGR
jgi:hypothetical protein